jgi:demethylspheroidene O-methyltransferase
MIEHHAVLYQDLQDPVALLLDQLPQGQMAKYWPYAETEPGTTGERRWQPDQVSRYSNLMSASQPFVVDEVIATYAFTDHRCVLDVGGGQGTFVSKLARHAPHLQLKLFDLPQVAALAQANVQQQGLAERASAVGGDFLRDALPAGADLITLVRVAHDHPDEHLKAILRAIHAALPLGGVHLGQQRRGGGHALSKGPGRALPGGQHGETGRQLRAVLTGQTLRQRQPVRGPGRGVQVNQDALHHDDTLNARRPAGR